MKTDSPAPAKPRPRRTRLLCVLLAVATSGIGGSLALRARPARRDPATLPERQALEGFDARQALLLNEVAALTSDGRLRAGFAALLGKASALGWDTCELIQSVKNRTGFTTPGLEPSSRAWIEAPAAPVSSAR